VVKNEGKVLSVFAMKVCGKVNV